MSPRGRRGRDADLVDLRELREVFRKLYDLLEAVPPNGMAFTDAEAAKLVQAARALRRTLADVGMETEVESRAAPEG